MTIHLSIILFWPLAFALAATVVPKRVAPLLGFVGALVPLGYAVVLLADFDRGAAGLQYVTEDEWIPELGVFYKLGIDGLSLWLIALTTFLFAAVAVWTIVRPQERPRAFAFHLAVAETSVLGALMAQDLALFVAFFDLMLVPFVFLVAQWGGGQAPRAALKLVIYTLVGSLLMLAAAVYVGVASAADAGAALDFRFSVLGDRLLDEGAQRWVFVGFALAFLIKMPAFLVHGWMPDGYKGMPLPALAVFSGVVSKVAAYGFLRIVLPLFPDASVDFQTVMLIIGLLGIVYGSAMAFTTTDARLVLGYSSVAQLGFILLGIFALNDQGAQGAILQSVNHGLVVAPVFYVILLLSERSNGSEDLRDMGGLAFKGPLLATLFVIVALATLAIPGSANFVGEFLILLGVFQSKLAIAAIAFTGVALASVYMLRAYIRTMHNRQGPDTESRDITVRDGLVLVPLVLAVLAFGVYPQLALDSGEESAQATVQAAADVLDPPEVQTATPGGATTPQVDPATGLPVDPATGLPIDPNTGQPIDPNSIPVDPSTGQPIDPNAAPQEVPVP